MERKEKVDTGLVVFKKKYIRCFTLVELLIVVALIGIISGVLYFTFDTSFESYRTSYSQLALSKFVTEVVDKIVGSSYRWGLKDALRIVGAYEKKVKFVSCWIDDEKRVIREGYIYPLNHRLMPGAPPPLGEAQITRGGEYHSIPVELFPSYLKGKRDGVRVGIPLPRGTNLRFIFYPYPDEEAINSIWWDEKKKAIFFKKRGRIEEISKNMLGIEVIDFKFQYYDRNNNIIKNASYKTSDIAAVEVFLKTKFKNQIQTITNFTALRNSPPHTGYFFLKEGEEISIPSSKEIHSFILTNFYGVENNDELVLRASSKHKSWRIKILFSKRGFNYPVIEKYTIEYPTGHTVDTSFPRVSSKMGFNLLSLGNGRYDYDFDEDVDDIVLLEGDVKLKVERMDMEGVGVFIKP